jgi:hypothetical protein
MYTILKLDLFTETPNRWHNLGISIPKFAINTQQNSKALTSAQRIHIRLLARTFTEEASMLDILETC